MSRGWVEERSQSGGSEERLTKVARKVPVSELEPCER